MPNLNWKDKTGFTETQLLQMLTAVIMGLAQYMEWSAVIVHGGLVAQFILGAVGVHLRSKDKVKQHQQTIRALDAVGRANEIIRLSEEAKDV